MSRTNQGGILNSATRPTTIAGRPRRSQQGDAPRQFHHVIGHGVQTKMQIQNQRQAGDNETIQNKIGAPADADAMGN